MISVLAEAVRNYLRDKLVLAVDVCDLAPDGHPPRVSGPEFLGIDIGETSNAARENIQEEYEILIYVCRRSGAWPEGKRGDMNLRSDPYLANLKTLEKRCREVIRMVHASWELIDLANSLIDVPRIGLGDKFVGHLFYVGQSGTFAHDDEQANVWLARRVVFRGGWRPQSLDLMG